MCLDIRKKSVLTGGSGANLEQKIAPILKAKTA